MSAAFEDLDATAAIDRHWWPLFAAAVIGGGACGNSFARAWEDR